MPPGNRSYRVFRFAWSTYPSVRPAVAAKHISEGEVKVYASWNGGTEVESWTVLAGERPDQLEPLGAVPRYGFETAMVARTSARYVAVQARGRLGRTRGTSKPVETGPLARSSYGDSGKG